MQLSGRLGRGARFIFRGSACMASREVAAWTDGTKTAAVVEDSNSRSRDSASQTMIGNQQPTRFITTGFWEENACAQTRGLMQDL
jgi:hypothetical protein